MTMISFWIPGTPKPQPRPRAFSRGGRARVFDPGTAEAWKSEIAVAARPHKPKTHFSGPVSIQLRFELRRPKIHYTRGGVLRDNAPGLHSKKPDVDNLAKGVVDALTELGWWMDDAQIWCLSAVKHYTTPVLDETGCFVTIQAWEDGGKV